LKADLPCRSGATVEGHGLAIDHVILLSPAFVGFSNSDFQCGIGSSPFVESLKYFVELLLISWRVAMLRHIHAKAVIEKCSWQIGMAIEEETVSYTEPRRTGERATSKLDDLNQIGIERWFST
jgi:hypothetical protein